VTVTESGMMNASDVLSSPQQVPISCVKTCWRLG